MPEKGWYSLTIRKETALKVRELFFLTENKHLKRFEDYLLARGRKSASRYLQVAQRFLEANPGEEEPFEARYVDRFLAALSRKGAGGMTLRWNYYVIRTFFRALGHPWPFQPGDAPEAEENQDIPARAAEDATDAINTGSRALSWSG